MTLQFRVVHPRDPEVSVALYRRSGYREIAGCNENPDADLWFEKHIATDRVQS
jgi:hypothetical protein